MAHIANENVINAIDRFLADNPELEELSALLSKFNVFRALKIEEAEIRHSNVLAWLLDPEQSHGLSDIVLRRVFSNILLLSDKKISGVSAARVELVDFSDIEVLREWHNIDIIVIDRNNKIVLFLENKIRSCETNGQLKKYKQTIEQEFPDFTIIPVFLTLTGNESRDLNVIDFITYSHAQLYAVLNHLYHQRMTQLAEPVQIFLEHYLNTLRRLTMQDHELIDLCKTIYRKHRDAVDLIVKYGMVSAFQKAMEDILKQDGNYEILYSNPTSVWFLPNIWTKIIPENGLSWPFLERSVSVCCWFENYRGTIYSHFEICKMQDMNLRKALIEELSRHGYKLGKKAFDENSTYSRFYGSSIKLNDVTDYDEVYLVVEGLLKKAKEEFSKAETVFNKIFS